MKKTIILMCLVGGLLSCAKPAVEIPADTPISFALNVGETKADYDSWINGDVIHVFFDGIGGKYVSMEFDGTDWKLTPFGEFTKGDFDALESHVLSAVYFPLSVDVAYADDRFSFTHDGEKVFSYYLHEQFSYSITDSTVTALMPINKKPVEFVMFYMEGLRSEVEGYSLGCPLIRPVACTSVGKDGSIVEEVLQAGARLGGIVGSSGVIFAGRPVRPDEKADYSFSLAGDYRVYTLKQEDLALGYGTIHHLPALSKGGDGGWTVSEASDLYVDLGLNVLWAKCNVGAETETEIGDFFSWGEICGYNSGKRNFSESEYLFGAGDKLSRYTGKDYVTLLKEDDAAYAALGGKFRIPTYAEWDELMCNCEWEWKGNGYLVTGKKKGYTDKSIFLPATSFRMNDELVELYKVVGCYWSSSLYDKSNDYAWYANLQPDRKDFSMFFRRYGCAVRPVSGYLIHSMQDYVEHDYSEK